MAKIAYRKIKLSKANKERLFLINDIIDEYVEQGYVLTLRQLYYQLVSRDVIPNQQKEYAKLSTLLKEGRMGGYVDWDAIEDRLRSPEKPSTWDSPSQVLRAAMNQYRKDLMENQKNYVEVWVEKDALSGVLSRITSKYCIPILVNRGYSSASAVHDSFKRFETAWMNKQNVVVLYLGDHDPSGLDMVRDIRERIKEFFIGSDVPVVLFSELSGEDKNEWEGLAQRKKENSNSLDDFTVSDVAVTMYALEYFNDAFKVIPIALTKEQIQRYDPPVNPAKFSDPRSSDYVKKHGRYSWEVDALKPEVLNRILESNILNHIDLDKVEKIRGVEEKEKEEIKTIISNYEKGK